MIEVKCQCDSAYKRDLGQAMVHSPHTHISYVIRFDSCVDHVVDLLHHAVEIEDSIRVVPMRIRKELERSFDVQPFVDEIHDIVCKCAICNKMAPGSYGPCKKNGY